MQKCDTVMEGMLNSDGNSQGVSNILHKLRYALLIAGHYKPDLSIAEENNFVGCKT